MKKILSLISIVLMCSLQVNATIMLRNGSLSGGSLGDPFEEAIMLFDSNDEMSVAKDVSDKVSQQNDLSRRGLINNSIQGTELNQCTWTANYLGNQAALVYDGTNSWMSVSTYNPTPDHHMFIVLIINSEPANNTADGIWGNYDGSGAHTNGEWRLDMEGEIGADRWRYIGFQGTIRTAGIISTSTPYLIEMRANNGVMKLFSNNLLVGTTNYSTTSTLTRGIALGSGGYTGGSSSTRLNGAIFFHVTFPYEQSPYKIQAIRNLVADKFPEIGL